MSTLAPVSACGLNHKNLLLPPLPARESLEHIGLPALATLKEPFLCATQDRTRDLELDVPRPKANPQPQPQTRPAKRDVGITGVTVKNGAQVQKTAETLDAKFIELDEEYTTKINVYLCEKVLGEEASRKLHTALKSSIKDLDDALAKAVPKIPACVEIDELSDRMCRSIDLSKGKLETNKEVLEAYEAAMKKLHKKVGESGDWKLPEDVKALGLSKEDVLDFAKNLKVTAARNIAMEAMYVQHALHGDLGTSGPLTFAPHVPPAMKAWIEKNKPDPGTRDLAIEKYGNEMYPIFFDYFAVTGSFGGINQEFKVDDTIILPGLKAWIEKKAITKEFRNERLKHYGIDATQGTFEKNGTVQNKINEAQKKAIEKLETDAPERLAGLLGKDFPGYAESGKVFDAYVKFDGTRIKFVEAEDHVMLKVKELGKTWAATDPKLSELLVSYENARAAAIEKAITEFKIAGAIVTEDALRSHKSIFSENLYPGLR